MKILIAADMEGVTGVVHADQTESTHPEYQRFRRLMTADVNAALRGAFDGGADEVVVSDGHGGGRNILIEELDGRARLNSGSPSPFSMMQGIDGGVQGVILIGYHARMGTPNAILDHTWSSARVADVWLNGDPIGEIGLNAALAGHFDASVIMISGDQTACAEAAGLVGSLETAVVKQATGRTSAECLPPEMTRAMIHDTAKRAVKRLRESKAPEPLRVVTPVIVAVEFIRSEMADAAALLPGARRSDKRIEVAADDMAAAYRAFRALVGLASL